MFADRVTTLHMMLYRVEREAREADHVIEKGGNASYRIAKLRRDAEILKEELENLIEKCDEADISG